MPRIGFRCSCVGIYYELCRCYYIINAIDRVIATRNIFLALRIMESWSIMTCISAQLFSLTLSAPSPPSLFYSLILCHVLPLVPLSLFRMSHSAPDITVTGKGYVIIISDVISESRIRFTGSFYRGSLGEGELPRITGWRIPRWIRGGAKKSVKVN